MFHDVFLHLLSYWSLRIASTTASKVLYLLVSCSIFRFAGRPGRVMPNSKYMSLCAETGSLRGSIAAWVRSWARSTIDQYWTSIFTILTVPLQLISPKLDEFLVSAGQLVSSASGIAPRIFGLWRSQRTATQAWFAHGAVIPPRRWIWVAWSKQLKAPWNTM